MKKIIVFLFLISLVLLKINNEKIIVPKDSIRFRIIANSNNKEDQELKLKIKKELKEKIIPIIENGKNKNEVKKLINENYEEINTIINKYTSDYSINYGQNYFPEKNYKNVVYKEGEYESLVITLGNGDGKNFFCVLYPPLCLVDEDDYEYSSLVKEILNHKTNLQ